MFNKKPIAASGNTHNFVTVGTVIKGNVLAEEDFRIDGKVEGNIECKGKVVIGQSGEVYGHINCTNAELMGKVYGNIRTTELLLLKGGSFYQGDLFVKTLEIEAGAIFNGTCKMGENKSAPKNNEKIQVEKIEIEKN